MESIKKVVEHEVENKITEVKTETVNAVVNLETKVDKESKQVTYGTIINPES